MTAQKISTQGRVTALGTFLIGTGIFVLYYWTDAASLLLAGYWFIVIAFIINIIILLLIVNQLRHPGGQKKRLIGTGVWMLLNIPVMLVYCWGTFFLLDTMRITFVNVSSETMTDIRIFGCQEGFIKKLDPGEKKQQWIRIPGDCNINIEYKTAGKQESVNVLGYVTQNMGKRITFKIGWENAPIQTTQ